MKSFYDLFLPGLHWDLVIVITKHALNPPPALILTCLNGSEGIRDHFYDLRGINIYVVKFIHSANLTNGAPLSIMISTKTETHEGRSSSFSHNLEHMMSDIDIVLVTGAAGFVAGHVIAQLLDKKYVFITLKLLVYFDRINI